LGRAGSCEAASADSAVGSVLIVRCPLNNRLGMRRAEVNHAFLQLLEWFLTRRIICLRRVSYAHSFGTRLRNREDKVALKSALLAMLTSAASVVTHRPQTSFIPIVGPKAHT
jgi:hypothetical protein